MFHRSLCRAQTSYVYVFILTGDDLGATRFMHLAYSVDPVAPIASALCRDRYRRSDASFVKRPDV